MKYKNHKYIDSKISETFLSFSSPLLDAIGGGATKSQIEKILKITYTVWNATVLDDVKGSTEYTQMISQTISDDPTTSALVEQFIARKRDLFADDLRLVGEYSITKKHGKWRLRVEARDPSVFR